MIISHIADIHIRLLKRHNEYKHCFDNYKKSLVENKVDRVVIVGDILHNKINLSPELVDLTKSFLLDISEIAPVDIVIGNHDCIVNQKHRMDAISAILSNVISNKNPIIVYKKSGIYNIGENVNYGVFAINDEENYPIDFVKNANEIYIALFHGAVNNSKTDVDYRLKTSITLDMFKNYDYVMLGDIHKHQYLTKNIAYCGSLCQQNYGESLEKGHIIWDTKNKTSKFVRVDNDYGFFTIKINKDKTLSEIFDNVHGVPKKPYIRILLGNSAFNKVEIDSIIKEIKLRFNPLSYVIEFDVNSQIRDMDLGEYKFENVMDVNTQQKMLKEWLKDSNISKGDLSEILELHAQYYNDIVYNDKLNRGAQWSIDRVEFENTFSYSSDNVLDFSDLDGIIGIFAENRAGKSSLLSVIMNGVFNMSDRVSQGNIAEIINWDKNSASISVYFTVDNKKYCIQRDIFRLLENRSKGRTRVKLLEYDSDNDEYIEISGDASKKDTESFIRETVGTYIDHRHTTFGMQDDIMSFLNLNQSGRKYYLGRFLGLDVINNVYEFIKNECDNVLKRSLKQFSEHDYDQLLENYLTEETKVKNDIRKCMSLKRKIIHDVKNIEKQMSELKEQLRNIDNIDTNKDELVAMKNKINDEIKSLNNSKKSLHAKINDNKKQLESLYINLSEFDNDEMELSFSELKKKKNILITLKNEVRILEESLKNNEKNIRVLNMHEWFETDANCKKCEFLKNAFHSREIVPSLKEKMENITLEIKNTEKEIENLNEKNVIFESLKMKKSNLGELENELKMFEMEINLLNSKEQTHMLNLHNIEKQISIYENNESVIIENKKINECILELEKKLEKNNSDKDVLDGIITKRNFELGTLSQKIEEIHAILDKMHLVERKYKHSLILKDAFSKNGIQLHIIKMVIPKINIELRKILHGINDFDIMLDVSDDLDINIYIDDGVGKRSLNLGSGMERSMGSIALRAALANISLVPKCNLFVIDEGFSALDTENIANVNYVLSYLKSIFKTVIIISHIKEIQDIVDRVITIERDEDGYSKLKTI